VAVINFAVSENILHHNLFKSTNSFVTGYITKYTLIVALSKIAASSKAACLRLKVNFCIIVCVYLIGGAVINFAVSENILHHYLKALLPIVS